MSSAATSFFTQTPFYFENATLPYVPAIRQFSAKYGTYSLVLAGVYVVVILAVQRLMASRTKMTLKSTLLVWNAIMAVFSTMGAIRTVPFLVNLLEKKGLGDTICDGSFYTDPVTNFWVIAFFLSKIPELIDTFFIVLRKQPLSFLHFFHHASVVVFASCTYHYMAGSGIFFTTMNYSVHAVMYSYYFFKCAGVRVPRIVSVLITSSQIIQMIVACAVTAYVYFGRFRRGLSCGSDTYFNVYIAATLYFAYFVLFAQFFYSAYIKKRPVSSSKQTGGAAVANGKKHHD